MKNLILFFLLAISQVNIYGQNCVYDSFNNRSEWTIVDDNIGNNKLKITNNSLNFDSVNCAKQSRAYKNVSIFKYWDFKFSIYINGFRSKIPAAFALGLTAGTDNSWFSRFVSSVDYTLSNQDALGVYVRQLETYDSLFLTTYAKNNQNDFGKSINNSGVKIQYNNKYYVKLSRECDTIALLSVYYDSDYLHHIPGSPFRDVIVDSIKNLNYFHSDIGWGAYDQRTFTAQMDNIEYCEKNARIIDYFSLNGTVHIGANKLKKALVRLYSSSNESYTSYSDSNGYFKFSVLPKGNYLLKVLNNNNSNGFDNTFYPNTNDSLSAYIIPLNSNILDLDVYMFSDSLDLSKTDNVLTISPNPITNTTTFTLSGIKNESFEGKIRIIDLYNDIVKESNINSPTKSFSIDLSNLSSGVYIVQINTNYKTRTVRIVKN